MGNCLKLSFVDSIGSGSRVHRRSVNSRTRWSIRRRDQRFEGAVVTTPRSLDFTQKLRNFTPLETISEATEECSQSEQSEMSMKSIVLTDTESIADVSECS